jgi:uncharacterized protein YjbJ (UPF0337 family)
MPGAAKKAFGKFVGDAKLQANGKAEKIDGARQKCSRKCEKCTYGIEA